MAEQVVVLMDRALHALLAGDASTFTELSVRMAGTSNAPHRRQVVRDVLNSYVTWLVRDLWEKGWEPADVVRLVRRRNAQLVDPARDVIAAELATYAAATVPPRWLAQLNELQATVWWPRERTWLHPEESRPWAEAVTSALQLAGEFSTFPSLTPLGPLPGEVVHTATPERPAVDERILAKVRALLAKAESTNFPAEAETFTAGAQAMMARHSIDRALLEAGQDARPSGPGGRRIGIDNPYEGPKIMLLARVSEANRCRVVTSQHLGFCTVVGHDGDLEAVELLFTSLLVQATAAITREGARQDAYGRSRTRSFRQSFLVSYAHRIGERLTEATSDQVRQATEASGGSNLLPVLAAREEAVEDAVSEMFPHLVERRLPGTSAYDQEGWVSGRAAADLAHLHPAAALD